MFEFKNFDYLTDGEIDLIIENKIPANEEKGYVPTYKYIITLHNSKYSIGKIDLRIGNNENSYYGGNIGYEIYEDYRGNGYASKACAIIKQVATSHGMNKLIRTCEKAGLSLKEIVDLPSYNEMYQKGERQKCIFEWNLK
ncbi:GNAT family N-acetyltransferase [Clostridium sp. YIM B02551]|uniref:GNAT family N-acetyltransferase n=1 Tax=Clostridium sp. YIM B02551 TaxID=2910679 RepID=UPI001EEB850C|nr:GNAT family N-acetyltransferase [Clostridium sp. YIM B02551]